MTSFRQWYQVNVDVKMLKDLFNQQDRNRNILEQEIRFD